MQCGADQTRLQYEIYGSTRVRYRVRVRFSGNGCLTFEIIPIFFEVLLISMCFCHFKSADKITPKEFGFVLSVQLNIID